MDKFLIYHLSWYKIMVKVIEIHKRNNLFNSINYETLILVKVQKCFK